MSLKPIDKDPPARRAIRISRIALVVALLIMIGAVLWGRSALTWWALREANQSLAVGSISTAEKWISYARRIDSSAYRVDLAQAACDRHFGDRDAWQRALDAAKKKDAPRIAISGESKLADIRWGAVDPISRDNYDALVSDGVPPLEAMTAVVQGLLAKGDVGQATSVLEDWPKDSTDAAQSSYLRGLCYWTKGERRAAQTEFEEAIQVKPQHEMAHASLGRLLEQLEQISEALPHYMYVARSTRARESIKLDLARVLRKLGRMDEAQSVLPISSTEEVSRSVALEIAEREYALGSYATAIQWFERADLEGSHLAETLRTAASAMALQGDFVDAQQLFARVDDAQANSRHASELRRRLSIDPNDRNAALDLQQLAQPATANDSMEQGSLLFRSHCSACHGTSGEADGRAARFLFPRPRNLRTEKLRLVSTTNGVAHRSDIARVIRQGMPGTSMPAFPKLSDDQVAKLVESVEKFRRAGVREQLTAINQHGDFSLDEDQIARLVAVRTTPSEILTVPPIGETSTIAIEQGREAFERFGCSHCHGKDGSNPPAWPLVDDSGKPIVSRDLARDPLKGGADAEAIFRRIRLGMPGTPHPALEGASEEQLVDLVQFCRSVFVQPKRILTNQQRAHQAAIRLQGAGNAKL